MFVPLLDLRDKPIMSRQHYVNYITLNHFMYQNQVSHIWISYHLFAGNGFDGI